MTQFWRLKNEEVHQLGIDNIFSYSLQALTLLLLTASVRVHVIRLVINLIP